jgi:hypothetical protein
LNLPRFFKLFFGRFSEKAYLCQRFFDIRDF